MIAVPSYGPLTLDLTFDDTRAWGTLQTGASGAYTGEAHGSVVKGGTQLEIEAPLSGPGCPEGLTVSVALNVLSGHAVVTFRLNGGAMSGPATMTRTN
jgi:hypothetical protein